MYQERVTKLKKLLQMSELDGIIVANGDNMHYLSGFLGGNGDGLVLVSQAGLSVITDARYEEELGQLMDDEATLIITRNYYQSVADLVEKQNLQRVGFEDDLAFKIFDLLDELIVADEFLPVPGIVEAMREIKDAVELKALQKACDVSIAAFNAVLPKIKVGMTELEISNELDYEARKRGAQKASFDTIVASGWRGALPHGLASNKPIAAGELVTVDFGYFVDGYTSDITRTFAVGDIEPELEKIYTHVQTAQKLVVEAVFNGVPSSELDRIGRDYITQAGYGKEFNHGMGHGIGLAIHEGPNISRTLTDEMVTNNLLTIEPGIYIPNLGGVRIEDDIVVTETGYVNLTAALSTDLIHI